MKLFGDRAGWLRATLLGLLLLVFLGAEIPELHDHEAGTPGLYNEECPLARLAVSAWGVPVVAADTLLRPDPALDPAAVPSSVDLPAPPRAVFAARAPPAS